MHNESSVKRGNMHEILSEMPKELLPDGPSVMLDGVYLTMADWYNPKTGEYIIYTGSCEVTVSNDGSPSVVLPPRTIARFPGTLTR